MWRAAQQLIQPDASIEWLSSKEQRGEDEVVACYSMSTGKPVCTHRKDH
jgi:hypothetical protein